MKWIGQHIWDYISRFRNDVYLEDISTGTIASGGNLGLDANNKIVKADTEAGELSFNGSTADGVLTYGNTTTIDVESTLTYSNETLTVGANDNGAAGIGRRINSSGNGGGLTLIAGIGTGTNANGGDMNFYAGAPTGSGTFGDFQFWSGDVEGSGTTLRSWSRIALLQSNAATSTDFYLYEKSGASEDDYLKISVAEHGATTLTTVDDNATVAHFSVVADGDIVLDSASGNIKTGSTTFVNNSGVVQVATQGTIDHDSLANFVANEHIDWTGDVSASSVIHTNNITDLHGAGVDGSANQLLTDDGDGTVTSESQATCNDGVLALTSATTGYAAITLTTTADGNKPTNFSFIKNRGSTTAADGDIIGFTTWISDNASGVAKYYAEHYVQATGVTSSDEHATHILTCATSTGTVSSRQNMITGLGSASANTVNTTLGYGAESTCTIAGEVVIEGDQVTIGGSSTQASAILFSEDTDNGTNKTAVVGAAAMTGNRTITLPDASGTVALTSDIVSGWHGSTTRIKILHSDFIISDTGRPYMIDDSGIGAEKLFGETNSTAPCFVTVAIPTGFDATHVMIYGFGTPAVEVWEHQITDKVGVSKGTGNVGTEIDITDVTSSATNYLFILVEQGSSDEIYGGYVTIAAT